MSGTRIHVPTRVINPPALSLEISSSEEEDGGQSNNRPNGVLGTLPLAVIVFYSVAGGPFGIEPSVRAAGAFYSILGFAVMPFVWSLPESMITAELGSAFPDSSAGVAWVEEAFGPGAGWMAGYLSWVSGATDNAIYPVLFLDYFLEIWTLETEDINVVLRFLLVSFTSLSLAYITWRGLQVVGNMSMVVCVLSLFPFFVMCVIGAFNINMQRWLQRPENPQSMQWENHDDFGEGIFSISCLKRVHWAPFLNNLFWNLNSFDSAASFSEEIGEPGRVLPRAMVYAVLLVAIGYLVPLVVAVGAVDSTQHDWVDGYLATVGYQIGGRWLEVWIVFAAGVSNLALFQAELSADAFQLMGMANRSFLPKIFATRSQYGTPTYAILLGVAVIIVMGIADLSKLIEMLNFNYAISLLMEYAAFLKLRISKPDVPRPFRIPFDTMGCAILIIPPVGATLIVIGLASSSTYVFSIFTNIIGVVIYLGFHRQCKYPRFTYSRVNDGII